MPPYGWFEFDQFGFPDRTLSGPRLAVTSVPVRRFGFWELCSETLCTNQASADRCPRLSDLSRYQSLCREGRRLPVRLVRKPQYVPNAGCRKRSGLCRRCHWLPGWLRQTQPQLLWLLNRPTPLPTLGLSWWEHSGYHCLDTCMGIAWNQRGTIRHATNLLRMQPGSLASSDSRRCKPEQPRSA